ncbi:MAG: DNA translocase FtsK [Clostridiales bacterium]|jgi:S-DNA-T family DNA segregation ATPase FtsK/SpoIIIE|nr:DNA translocase FtsK [Clostridiales bacterium]
MEEKKGAGKKAAKKALNPLYLEILRLLFVGLSVFLMISVYIPEGGGVIGEDLSLYITGMLGFGALPVPIMVFMVAWRKMISPGKRKKGRIFWSAAALLCVISIAHLLSISGSSPVNYSGDELFQAYYIDGSFSNGGLIGGIIGDSICEAIGYVGSMFLLVIFLAATVILLTGRSLTATLRDVFGSVVGLALYIKSGFADDSSDETADKEKSIFLKKNSQDKKSSDTNNFSFKKKSEHIDPPPQSDPQPPKQKRQSEEILLVDFKRNRNRKRRSNLQARPVAFRSANDRFSVHNFSREIDNIPVRGLVEELDDSAKNSEQLSIEYIEDIKPAVKKAPVDTEESQDTEFIDEMFSHLPFGAEPFETIDTGETLFLDDEINPSSSKNDERELILLSSKPDVSRKYTDSEPPLKSMSIPDGICDAEVFADYKLPSIDFLKKNTNTTAIESKTHILENAKKLEDTLRSFKVEAKVVEVSVGPTVTRYELSPGQGVKVSSIANLSNDLALSLAAQGIRIEAPIPGKSAVGIEIPNKEMQPVFLREILDDEVFKSYPSKLAFAVGKDIGGNAVVSDVAKMPHLLIAGATGSGKSVCINSIIASILYKARPDEVKLLMIDPKVVELSVYNGIPHLLVPVVSECKKASAALAWAVAEMDIRYNLFAETNVRDLKSFNAVKLERGETDVLPQIVIIVDELADLMMVAKGEIEELICRLAQKARAAGLHLILATQRPSVDVITGLIKANVPSRMAFAVSSGTDSRTVLDMTGAEKLLGKGDMLFLPVGRAKPIRVQCALISDHEVEELVDFLKEQNPVMPDREMAERVIDTNRNWDSGDLDQFYNDAVEFLISKGKASASMLQRQFRIGYNRASRLIEELEARGIVGPEDGSKPRKVLVKMEQWRGMTSGL